MKRIVGWICLVAMLITCSVWAMPVSAAGGAEDEREALASKWSGEVPEADAGYHFAGAGSAENPYLIQSAADLAQLAANARSADEETCYSGKHFLLTVDVDLGGHPWHGIGGSFSKAGFPTSETEDIWYSYFAGNFNGGNHVIYGLSLANTNVNGLFGYVRQATVRNLGIESGNSELNNVSRVGCLVGGESGGLVLENCYNRASLTVTGTTTYLYAGGILGLGLDGGTVTMSSVYNTGEIIAVSCGASFRVGGVVGSIAANSKAHDFSLTDCYAFGKVSVTHAATKSDPKSACGVFAGALMDGVKLSHCYAYAEVSSLNSSSNTVRAWHFGSFAGNISTASGELIQNTACAKAEATDERCTWAVGNSATIAANSYIAVEQEPKTLSDFLPAGEHFLKDGTWMLADAPAFIGHQESAVTNGTYSVRFVMGLDSLDYDGAEFEIEATYLRGGETVTAKNGYRKLTTVYREILADGEDLTAISNGHSYMALMAVKGVPADVEISFTVRSYVYENGVKTLVDTDSFVLNVLSGGN